MHTIVYISGKIADGGKATDAETNNNVELARRYAMRAWLALYKSNIQAYIITPHLNGPWENRQEFESIFGKKDPDAVILQADLSILNKADIVLMMPNWKESASAKVEHQYAITNNIPICYDIVDLHRYLGKYHPKCSICGRLRKGLKKAPVKLKICHDCYPKVEQVVKYYKTKDFETFIKIPRNP